MSPELKDLLDDAARAPRRRVDVDDIHRRGRRSRATELVAGVAALALVAGGVAFGVVKMTEERAPAPFISEAPTATPSTPAPATPAPGQQGVVTAAHLDADVFLAVDASDDTGDGHVLVQRPDGTSYQLPIGTATPSEVALVVDGQGGVSWQASGGDQGTAPIIHVDGDGASRTVVDPSAFSPPDTYRLVGGSEFALLVERSRGTTPESTTGDLLSWWAGGTGSQPDVLARNTSGWESAVMSAASLEVTVYVLAELSGTSVVVDPPDRDPTIVWRGDEATGEEAADVDVVGDPSGGALVLVRTTDGAELLTVDMFAADPTVRDRIEVPLGLGADAGDVRATEISIHAPYVLVNRHTADGGWLRPLVHDLEIGTWSVLEGEGRALLARPVPDHDIVGPPCVDDGDLRNAPPEAGALHLYLLCSGGEQMHADAYRHPSDLEVSGDVATDARAVLDLALGELHPQLERRGYVDLGQVPAGSIGVHDVRFSDGTLVVDFDFPDGGVGNLGTSFGGAMWATFVRANLLHIDGVEVLELHAEGSCDGYSNSFESTGCVRYTTADAPWEPSG